MCSLLGGYYVWTLEGLAEVRSSHTQRVADPKTPLVSGGDTNEGRGPQTNTPLPASPPRVPVTHSRSPVAFLRVRGSLTHCRSDTPSGCPRSNPQEFFLLGMGVHNCNPCSRGRSRKINTCLRSTWAYTVSSRLAKEDILRHLTTTTTPI